MEFGYVDWNSFIWGIIITVGVIQGYKHRYKWLDFEDKKASKTEHNQNENRQYKKGA